MEIRHFDVPLTGKFLSDKLNRLLAAEPEVVQKHREPLFKCYHQLNRRLQLDKENQAGFLYIVHHSNVVSGN